MKWKMMQSQGFVKMFDYLKLQSDEDFNNHFMSSYQADAAKKKKQTPFA